MVLEAKIKVYLQPQTKNNQDISRGGAVGSSSGS